MLVNDTNDVVIKTIVNRKTNDLAQTQIAEKIKLLGFLSHTPEEYTKHEIEKKAFLLSILVDERCPDRFHPMKMNNGLLLDIEYCLEFVEDCIPFRLITVSWFQDSSLIDKLQCNDYPKGIPEKEATLLKDLITCYQMIIEKSDDLYIRKIDPINKDTNTCLEAMEIFWNIYELLMFFYYE